MNKDLSMGLEAPSTSSMNDSYGIDNDEAENDEEEKENEEENQLDFIPIFFVKKDS